MEEEAFAAPAFHNTEPRSRDARMAPKGQSVPASRGKHHTHTPAGANCVQPDPGSPLYAPEAARFRRDVAEEIRHEKMEAQRRQQEVYQHKRQQAMLRESQHWQQMEAEQQREEERVQRMREMGTRGKQNRGSEHFDIISLTYHATREGKQLQYKDEVTRYRAVLRSQNLFAKSHSVPHNIITGDLKANPIGLPPAPVPPQ